ncbi:MAG TPA: Kdo hydroxylase family protein [Verrucomicrobiae bacterium]|nr:Kdo hydroxylase family protein [Verrucomicrobiae bacterium]
MILTNTPSNTTSTGTARHAPAATDVLVHIDNFKLPPGWSSPVDAAMLSRQCCEHLEDGRILYFDGIPFEFPGEDLQFLLSQRQSGSRLHKNVSFRPRQDVLRGAAGDPADVQRLKTVMRRYSQHVTSFIRHLLMPYTEHFQLDYASFRPEQEEGRDLPVHKRNDLLHFDAFPTRPMHGRRILRCFTNVNPTEGRIWNTTDGFSTLAGKFAADAGLAGFAAHGSPRSNPLVRALKKAFGMKAVDHSAYDRFMLRFHDYLKENTDFQQSCPKTRIEYAPGSTWLCYTDSVPHAVLSGQYALEQTFIIPLQALVAPEKSPLRVLEKLAGMPLTAQSA